VEQKGFWERVWLGLLTVSLVAGGLWVLFIYRGKTPEASDFGIAGAILDAGE